jgi:hypothetical protein
LLETIVNNRRLLIGIHLAFGFLGTLPLFPKLIGLLTVGLPFYFIYSSQNRDEEAFLFASYVVGAEVFIRMTGGFVFYETGKYAVILYLLLGLFVGGFHQKIAIQYLTYILLLLVGILFTQVPEGESLRKNILFNLSGPIGLGVAAFYFYQRTITKQQLYDALFFMLLPLISMVVYLYFRTPDLKEIVFGGEANFAASGGFGPNQVATAIGLGIFILTVFLLSKYKLTGYVVLDALFLVYFIFRGLLTFSRGGIITALIVILGFAFFFLIYNKGNIGFLLKYILVGVFFIFAVWIYTLDVTGGMLNNRYTGKNAAGIQKDITTGRADLLSIQVENFFDNPLGIGVGNGKYERFKRVEHVTGASHNEVGRLLEEHGYIGLILLVLLLLVPLFNFFRGNSFQKAFIVAFYLLWFLTINHSAMRIALPGFIYALSLINIVKIDE